MTQKMSPATPGRESCAHTLRRKPLESTHVDAFDPCSDLANARRLVKHFGDRMMYVPGIGWHTWGPPWRHDELRAKRYAHQLGKLIAVEASILGLKVAAATHGQQKQLNAEITRLYKWAGASENASSIAASLRLAESLLAVPADELDADAELYAVQNGVIDLKSCTHRPHDQADRITKQAGCAFDRAAVAPQFESFIEVITEGNRGLIDYLQRLIGYSLSGHRGEHVLPICIGRGANGKSTFLGLLQELHGEYAGTASPDLLISRGGSEHPTSLASLQGRRLVVVSETGESGRLNEERLKLLAGGDVIAARRMRQDFYEFRPTHLLMLQTNHRPRATGTDEGLWRRLRLIPFLATIPPDQRDPELPQKLRSELPGILNWALEGYRRYKSERLVAPGIVREATNHYRGESDHVGEFVDQECDVAPQHRCASADLYRTYSAWCAANGEVPQSAKVLGAWLSENGCRQFRTQKARGWIGIKLNDRS